MAGSLWDFALDFYHRPGVSAACLTLQDEAGIDVIELIVLLYADWLGRPLDGAELARLRADMAEWRAGTVLPLRAVRRFLKAPLEGHDAGKEALRNSVKAAELAAEKLQLALAEDWLRRHEPSGGLALPAAVGELVNASAAGEPVRQAVETVLSARAAMLPS